MNNKQLAEKILEYVGGKQNVTGVTHCITRLRIIVNDISIIKQDEIKKLDIMGVNLVGTQFQVILGPKVADVFKEFEPLIGVNKGGQATKEKKGIVSTVIDTFTGIFTPILPAIIGAGLLKGILLFCMFFGIIATDSDMFKLLMIFSDAAYYFLPMLLAVSTATHFKCNKYVAMAVAGVMLHPDLIALLGGDAAVHFLGVLVTKASYSSSVLPIILTIYLMSYIERFFAKVVPEILRTIFVPLLTVFVTGFIALVAVGPLGSVVSNVLARNFLTFYMNYGVIAGAIFAGLFPAMVLLGIHNGFTPVMVQSLSTYGVEYLMGLNVASNSAQSGATLAVSLKTKNKDFKSLAGTAALNAIIGITEPALYGITSKLKRPLIAVMIGGAVGGGIAGYFHVTATGMGTGPLAGLPLFLTGTFVYYVISCVISFIIAFALTFLIGFEDVSDNEYADNDNQIVIRNDASITDKSAEEEIAAPIQGKVIDIEQVQDAVFSRKTLGDGMAIVPSEGKVYAPFDGTVSATVESRHAIGLSSVNGCNVLIHVGLNTVELNGEGFTYHVSMGNQVKKGDLLMEFDIKRLTGKGYTLTTPVIVNNAYDYSILNKTKSTEIEPGEILIYLEK